MSKILEGLNPQQTEAVMHPDGPLLILAGAGSGKTRVITRRIAFLVKEKKVDPENILAVTFTNKAAQEMKSRIESLLGMTKFPWMGTFHAIAAKILRVEFTGIGKPSDFTIIDTADQLSIVRDCFKELNLNEKTISPSNVLKSISFAKNALKTPDEFESEAHGYYPQTVARVYRMYQERLQDSRCLDFDDLIMQAALIFKEHPKILKKYQDRFEHVLIDEYQDVNFAQYTLARYFCGKSGNICVVGDDDQSIYGFRGADVSIILKFENDFPGTKTIKLEENYRSSKYILDAANAVVCNNKGRKNKKLWTSKNEGERIGSKALTDGREEARYVIKEINRWLKDGLKLKDMAILYRTNSQSRSMEEVLKQEGIDYDIVGGLRFYERAEIKDTIAYIKFILNPRDSISFKRIINVPARGIGNITRDRIITESIKKGVDFLGIMKDASDLPRVGGKIQETLASFSQTIEALQKDARELQVSDFIDKVLKETGYIEALKEEEDPRKFERLDNLEELINDAKEFELSSEDRSIEAFLEKVALYMDIDSKKDTGPDQDGKVTLMTVHAAKGLEFPVVFIVGLEEGLFPHMRSIEDNKESALEEERRLFYVAMTRAQKKIYLTYARERTTHGKFHIQSPSRFLREVPEELLDTHLPEVSKRSFTRKVPSILTETKVAQEKSDKYSQGDLVYHKIFGKGVVRSSEKGYVTAEFTGNVVKILSQDFLNPYGENSDELKPGDKVKIDGAQEGVLKKHDNEYAYVIVSGGDVEKVPKDRVTLKKA